MISFVAISAIALFAGAQASYVLPNVGCGGYPLPGYPLGGYPLGGYPLGGLPLGERTIGHSCQCTKTVVQPQLSQQIYDKPVIQRVVKNTVTPVVKNYRYNTRSSPVCESPYGLGYPSVGPIDYPIGYPTVGPIGCGYPTVGPIGCGYPTVGPIVGASPYGLGLNEVAYPNAGLVSGGYVDEIVAGPSCGVVY